MKPSTVIKLLGGTAAVARHCKCSGPAVTQWKTNGIPMRRVPSLMKLSRQVMAVPLSGRQINPSYE